MRISDWSSDVCSSDLLCGNANSIRLVSAGIGLTRSRIILAAYAGEIIPPREEIGRLGLELSAGVPGFLDDDRHVFLTEKAAAPDMVRSEERRVGKEWVSPCSSRWSSDN